MSTLLCIAAANGHLKTVQLLLDKGAEVGQFRGTIWDLIQSNSRGAAEFPNLQTYWNDLLQTPLCAVGANTADMDKDGVSALLRAIQRGHDEIVKLLLNYRALLKADESQRARTLDLACRSHRTNLALLLLARHSREWTRTTDGAIFNLNIPKPIGEVLGGAKVPRAKIISAEEWIEEGRRQTEIGNWIDTLRKQEDILYIVAIKLLTDHSLLDLPSGEMVNTQQL